LFPFHFGNSPSDYTSINDSLKVDGNENTRGVVEVIVIQVLYGIVAIEGYFKFELVLSL
jgi:hypothetical protein